MDTNPTNMADNSLWDASLSTMWAIRNFPVLKDFFIAAQRLGFARVELNHQVDSSMLAGIDLSRFAISSVHEPCPADISVEDLKARDWMISSPDEENRKQGVLSIKRSLDLASRLGVRWLVVHSGNVTADSPLEKELFNTYKAGQAGTPGGLSLKARLEEERSAWISPRLESTAKSLVELLEYARPRGIRLGLENRYHFMDIPLPDEMEQLLALGGADELGFWYDIGHAQTLDRLGFFPHVEWLQRFATRIIGVHLHDVVGVVDHDAPGAGEVDFAEIGSYLPQAAVRTLEIRPAVKAEQIKNGLQFLASKGCIRSL